MCSVLNCATKVVQSVTNHPVAGLVSKSRVGVIIFVRYEVYKFELWSIRAIEPEEFFVPHVPVDRQMTNIWTSVPFEVA